MKIENVPLFTEYERQFKRKFPGLKCSTDIIDGAMKFTFELIKDNVAHEFSMVAIEPAKNGYITCLLQMDNNVNDNWHEFDESRKPMEMNVDNVISVAKYMMK